MMSTKSRGSLIAELTRKEAGTVIYTVATDEGESPRGKCHFAQDDYRSVEVALNVSGCALPRARSWRILGSDVKYESRYGIRAAKRASRTNLALFMANATLRTAYSIYVYNARECRKLNRVHAIAGRSLLTRVARYRDGQ